MYTIKETPEDFKVTEIACFSESELGEGEYTYCLLEKRNIGTIEAVKQIAVRLGIPVKRIGFAGNKDKKAVTSQFISVEGEVSDLSFGDITVTVIGKSDTPIHLGYLSGNSFEIVVRGVEVQDVKSPFIIPNLFGEQRFSSTNADVGRAIVKGDFKGACGFVIAQGGRLQESVEEHLHSNPTDVVGALRCVPGKLLMLFVHAYQSLLFNELVSLVEGDVELPLIGFGTEIDEFGEDVQKAVENIMEREEITCRDFIIRALPELSTEGTTRTSRVEVADFEMVAVENGVVLKFSLPKNSYATVVVDQLFGKN
jgi:tRNA pseudouridine13 synthase